jgi:glutamate dehydrogenase
MHRQWSLRSRQTVARCPPPYSERCLDRHAEPATMRRKSGLERCTILTLKAADTAALVNSATDLSGGTENTMLKREEDRRQALVSAAIKAVGGRGKTAATHQDLVDALFSRAAPEDLEAYAPEDLAALAQQTAKLMAKRGSDEALIRVYNPEPTRDSTSLDNVTVIEVLNNNMPFLLDSAMAELNERGLELRMVLHPILRVARDKKGAMSGFGGLWHRPDGEEQQPNGRPESLLQIHVARIDSDMLRKDLQHALENIFSDVSQVVADWKPMLSQLDAAIARYRDTPPPIPVEEIAEAIQFLEWLRDNNFTFLGVRQYAFVGQDDSARFERIKTGDAAGLGLLADPAVKVLRRGREFVTVTPEIRDFLTQPVPLIVTKANVKSTVHRRVHLDYIGVKTFDDDGNLTGELRIVGLYTSTAYNKSVRSIPFLRRKAAMVMQKAGFDPDGHSGKGLQNVLDTYPRDDFFQIDIDTLYQFTLAIHHLSERPRIRVLPRPDKFDRFVSVLVFVPRDRYTTEVRRRVGELLARAYHGRVSAFFPAFLEGTLTRVHYIIGRYEGETPNPDVAELETEVARLSRNWRDSLNEALDALHDPLRASRLAERYKSAFSPAYQQSFGPGEVLRDIETSERLEPGRPLAIDFYRPDGAESDNSRLKLKIFNLHAPIPLSERVPLLENMAFRVISERSFQIERPGEVQTDAIYLHDMTLAHVDGSDIDIEALGGQLESAFMAIIQGRAENDGYNALVVKAGIAWRDIAMLRAVSRYLRQVRIPFSQDYMWDTLSRYPEIARALVDLFHTRFDPANEGDRSRAEAKVMKGIEALLEDVPSLDDDRIVRRFANIIRVTQRTNYFQIDLHGQPPETLSFKIASQEVEALPEPKPFREIFVYSPRVEGVHLRFGYIARGGLRWSDRPQDFRTEVLGLVKAQQVKNAVIVPVGAKGGFVPKQMPANADRETRQSEGTACYKLFVSSLLDITDNLDGETIIPPQMVVRHDGDDAYLVVAADKGTATFSDTANAISEGHDFWLGDAFASGGSQGYDHKKMGITARGGWEAVKRHFREMDHDIQTEPFTVVGVGDMSGDVFGNGMLLSEKIRLLAAFDHRDIFVDPDPDTAKSFAERKRLFELGRSSWQDYDTKLISKGGGIFSRAEKSIPVSPQMAEAFGLKGKSTTPVELMRAILKSDADLLWFGGIGTYVRAPYETDDDADDRANDALRITSDELRVKVIGEGANLGVTHPARIAFAMRGGKVNSDAIDNSAGVNSSDLEVNIKIALGQVVRDGGLAVAARNRLLASMTDDVAELCLRNNYLQTLALSLAQMRGLENMGFAKRMMRELETQGALDREVEDLPKDADLAERETQAKPLTRPELAVLLAYAKIDLYKKLLDGRIPDDVYLEREIGRYFPPALSKRYDAVLKAHPLRREIIATMLSNSIINRGGPTFLVRVRDETGAEIDEIAAAFALSRDSYGMTELNGEIDALDNKVPGALQLELYAQLRDLLAGSVVWYLRNADLTGGLKEAVSHYKTGIDTLSKNLSKVLPQPFNTMVSRHRDKFEKAGVPKALAGKIAQLFFLSRAPDIIRVADITGKPLTDVAETFFAVGQNFSIGPLINQAQDIRLEDYYARMAMSRTLDQLSAAQRRITARLVANGATGDKAIADWEEAQASDIGRVRSAIDDLMTSELTLPKLMVATGLFGDLARE